jgi:5-methylcytosine-specific restriction protein B
VNASDRQAQFNELIAECSRTFLAAPAGEVQRLAYLRARQSGQQNYATVAQLDAQGIDITNAVLLKLLPYSDTELHRAQGAWIHNAGFITGELRRWYEASGMTQAGAWPTIARALWQFIQRCVANPADLADACRDFAAEPATKGFQTSMVTPILNALQPDHFLLFNRKSRTTLNYFTGADVSHTMLDYPAANAALQHFIAEQATLQQLAQALEMRPGDLFDLFSHWLVSIRSFAFRPPAYWRLTLDDDPIVWDEWQDGGYVALGWDEMGDVSEIGQSEFQARRDSLLDQYPTWRKRDLNQLWYGGRTLVLCRRGWLGPSPPD